MYRRLSMSLVLALFSFSGVAQHHQGCSGSTDDIADGWCDPANNNVDCGYDGGDCCECTCVDGEYTCGFGGFDCINPDAADPLHGCDEAPIVATPCSTDSPLEWTIGDTASALAFADAVRCSGGYFHVEWNGGVIVNRTIYVANGTTVNVTGTHGAAVVGGARTQPFAIVNASLYISNMRIRNGYALAGGAIAATGSTLAFQRISFVDNKASGNGGAVHAASGSIVSMGETIEFVGNKAGSFGGAIFVDHMSVVSWSGATRFADNSAADFGGALYIGGSSKLLGEGVTTFLNNTAGNGGGAMHLGMNSTASWEAETSFIGNSASFGGAIHATSMSSVSWGSETTFHGNRAHVKGGAFAIFDESGVSWDAETTFDANTAGESGGALHLSLASNVFWRAATNFSHNSATTVGGATALMDGSTASWQGETSFIDNSASMGGAISITSMSSVSWEAGTTFSGNRADFRGGALDIVASPGATWDAETTFYANTAGVSGGALSVWLASNVSWRAATNFSENSAWNGGAVAVFEGSNASWQGETSFIQNNSSNVGGAISILLMSSVWWGTGTVFRGNSARFAGGAVFAMNRSEASWDAESQFLANTAVDVGGTLGVGGAIYADLASIVSWHAPTTFSGNNASDAGAIFLFRGSTTSWDAETHFSGNFANRTGGALVMIRECSSLSKAKTIFSSNSANYGGAVLLAESSSTRWKAETIFEGNTASAGGALAVSLSEMSWEEISVFSGNKADIQGGAIFASTQATLRWEARTTFDSNTAEAGGAVTAAEGANLLFGTETAFWNNVAFGAGGALMVTSSTVLWAREAIFSHNVAYINGGAAYVVLGSSAHWEGGATFFNNTSFGNGGALYCVDGHVSVEGHATFLDNRCAGSGGALVITRGSSFTQRSADVTFYGNAAVVLGGAMFVSDVIIGPHFKGVQFLSNTAQIGGAVYITGSGVLGTEGDVFALDSQNPTVFERCVFVSNTAKATGGAMDSSAGMDVINDTLFEGNVAGVGGALRLAGTAFLQNCTFHENASEEGGGAAVSNIGFVADLSNASYDGNGFNCDPGKYLNYRITNSSSGMLDVVCEGCAAPCTHCTYSGGVPQCVDAIEHSTSAGGNVSLESLRIDDGYWRATNRSLNIMKCYNEEACRGGVTGAPDNCRDGYEGPYCAICSDGFTARPGFVCNSCSDNTVGFVLLALVSIAALFIIFGVFLFVHSDIKVGDATGGYSGMLGALKRRFQSLKIVIIVWQIITQFTSVANVVYPGVYQRLLDGVALLNFDISWVFSVGCIIDFTFHERLLVSTVGPLALVVPLGISCVVPTYLRRASNARITRVRLRKYLSVVFLLSFLMYSPVSSMLFQMFACDELDDGSIYLRADYRIECDSLKHEVLQVYACLMMLLYTVGIPVLYAVVLYRNRKVLMDTRAREEDAVARSISNLWELYKPNRIYYELVECARRVLLAGVVVFIYPDTAGQVVIAFMMSIFFLLAAESLAPYAAGLDAWVSRMGHTLVCISMFLALLLKVDVTTEHSASQRVYEAILVFVHACMILAIFGEVTVTILQSCKTSPKETSRPTRRRIATSRHRW